LLCSEKDRAENLMIVDLVRNDLGRVCRYGSVAVPELCRAEEHPGVWHLVSDVTGELTNGVSDAELVRASFPPGSVTGAPKVRAMELVSMLEGTAREVYTGAIGIVSPLNGLELNVAIRTFELAEAKAWLGIGGGVVADSNPDRELEECFDKARPLLAAVGAELRPRPNSGGLGVQAAGKSNEPAGDGRPASGVFETILVISGKPVELESHLGRLAASVSRLYGIQLTPRLGARIVETAFGVPGSQRLRVRVWPSPDGGLESEITILAADEAFTGVVGGHVALFPTVVRGGFGCHKWHDRGALSERRELLDLKPDEQLLLLDEDGTVLEAEQANVFAVLGGVVRTAPLDGRLLAGTTRQTVIRVAAAQGIEVLDEPFTVCELCSAEEVFLTSSIRGLRAVGEVRGSGSFDTGPTSTRLAKALWESWITALGPSSAPDIGGFARRCSKASDIKSPDGWWPPKY
jgi:para-aminobenzoate synthetase/4-amino-4-deoxychorismate lyase